MSEVNVRVGREEKQAMECMSTETKVLNDKTELLHGH